MDNNNTNTNEKNKDLNYNERYFIQIRLLQYIWSVYKIAKHLKGTKNTILNEIRCGTTTQINNGKHAIVEKIESKTVNAVMIKLKAITDICGNKFNKVLKVLQGDNG